LSKNAAVFGKNALFLKKLLTNLKRYSIINKCSKVCTLKKDKEEFYV